MWLWVTWDSSAPLMAFNHDPDATGNNKRCKENREKGKAWVSRCRCRWSHVMDCLLRRSSCRFFTDWRRDSSGWEAHLFIPHFTSLWTCLSQSLFTCFYLQLLTDRLFLMLASFVACILFSQIAVSCIQDPRHQMREADHTSSLR